MSYSGLGATYRMSTPWGSQNISIPIEDIARDTGMMVWNAAWPPLRGELEKEMPSLIGQGMDMAYEELQKHLPDIMSSAVDEVQPKLRLEVDRAVKIATSRLVVGVTILSAAVAASTFLIIRKVGRR